MTALSRLARPIRSWFGVLVSIGVITAGAEVDAQEAKTPDARVTKLFEAAGIKFAVEKTGDIKALLPAEGDRTQMVTITSGTNTMGDLEVREVFTVAYLVKDPLAAETMTQLLEFNNSTVLGAWRLLEAGDQRAVIFAAQIPAEVNWKTLLLTMSFIAKTADQVEKIATGADEY